MAKEYKFIIAISLIWVAIGIAASNVFGMIFDKKTLSSISPGEIPMAVATAVCVIFLSISLLLLSKK